MSCQKHEQHEHIHTKGCGHTAIKHGDHIDYLHDGHLHHPHDDHIDEHVLEVSIANPDQCQPLVNACTCQHNDHCEHEAVPHGDHIDYIVNGRLHHPHGDHCDDHGAVEIVS